MQSPVTADLYASLDVKSSQTKSIAIAKQPLQQQSASNTSPLHPKPKKLRHRRIASGSGISSGVYFNHPKSSPVRDRRYQSDPEVSRKVVVQLVNTETQTDHTSIIMDMSETDSSPGPFVASRELSACLRDSGRGRSIEDVNQSVSEDANRNDNSAMLDVTSPNGNRSSHCERGVFHDACSGSDDPLDDAMNSNDRQRLGNETIKDDENLERLGRRVSAFYTENRHSIRSDNGNNGNTETSATNTLATSDTFGEKDEPSDLASKQGLRLDVKSTAARRGFISSNGDGREVTVIRCGAKDEVCNDSWTDEEGEDPDKQYSYLRRKR